MVLMHMLPSARYNWIQVWETKFDIFVVRDIWNEATLDET